MTASFEFDGVVRLTKIGTTYVLSTIILSIAALNTGNNALYIAVALMLGCLLLSGLASKGGLRKLEVEIASIDEAWAGHPADGTLRVRNRSRIWNVRDIVFVSPDLAKPVFLALLPRRAQIAVPASFLFERRGVVELKTIDSYTRYPFGFFLKKRRIRVQSEVVVFPRLLAEESQRDRFRGITGDQTTEHRPGQGTEIHSFREYTRGDSMRQIHWKKSASLGRWIVRQTEAESARSVHVVVDPYRPRSVTVDAFEEMISEAATFIHDASADGFAITLSLPRADVHARERQSASPLFRALALVEAVYEPLHDSMAQIVDRDAVFFSAAGGRDDAKSA
jgi:uncharacterized protein (DUF58 family)